MTNMPSPIEYPNGQTREEYFAWLSADVKRVRSIPYREESLDPFQDRDDWLDQPAYLRCDPRGAF